MFMLNKCDYYMNMHKKKIFILSYLCTYMSYAGGLCLGIFGGI